MTIAWANETRKLRDLIPWEHNPREINTKEAQRLGDSLEEFGQIQTIAIGPDDEVYDGHQRKAVWSLLPQFGPDHEVDVRVSSRTLTDKERQKLVVYLHRGTAGTWNWDELANTFEVPELLEWGFEESELQLDWGNDATPDPGAQVDKAAELQKKWQVQRGQVWQVGRHRIMCGDSTCAEDVGRLMGGERAQAVVTDPPYGIGWDTDYTRFTTEYGTKRVNHAPITNDDKEFDPSPYLDYDKVVLWGANWYCRKIPVGTWLVWDKRHPNGTAWLSDAELAWMKGKRGVYIYAETVQGAHRKEKSDHPTQKPVGAMAWCMKKAEIDGDVYDPFLGSGTTLVACEQTNRIGYGMEIEPKYVAVTLERLSGMGLEAVLVDD